MQFYQVSQVANYLQELLATDLHLTNIWVEGEVTNLKRTGAGHTFFGLKDPGAQLRCALFASKDRGYRLADGDQVLCQGYVEFYPSRGEITFAVGFIQPAGVGPLGAEFERLKTQLDEEGLFDASRKRALPAFPRRIGVITSPDAAAWQDIQRVLARRWPLLQVVLAPTAVQGAYAVPGILEAFESLLGEPDLDLVIVARGGGSIEDLWAFNEEAVARAVFRSPVPVITGIGHEQDTTIADYVADLRASTPSAAAELAVPDQLEIRSQLAGFGRAAAARLLQLFRARNEYLAGGRARLSRALPNTAERRARVAAQVRNGNLQLERCLSDLSTSSESLTRRISALSPQATLDRGYAVVQADGRAIRSPQGISSGQPLAIRLADGDLDAVAGRGNLAGNARRRNRQRASELQAALPFDGVS
jgi:exodeoxyribonuclease VII large subunit